MSELADFKFPSTLPFEARTAQEYANSNDDAAQAGKAAWPDSCSDFEAFVTTLPGPMMLTTGRFASFETSKLAVFADEYPRKFVNVTVTENNVSHKMDLGTSTMLPTPS